MKKIIVPTDFSECSVNALKVASDITRKLEGAELHLVHVYERPIYGISLQFGIDNAELKKIKDSIHKEMHALADSEFLKGLKVYMHYIPDKEIWEFLNEKHLKNPDLIVMGSHGARGMKELFVGSNTQKVVQLATCPVLTVKNPIKIFRLRDLVFVSSFNSQSSTTLESVKSLADLFGASIHLLKVNTPNFFETTPYSTQTIENVAKNAGLKKYKQSIYNHISVEDGILSFCKNSKPDLIVMETHGRTGVAHLLTGSITEHIVNNVTVPVLSYKVKESKKQKK